jgi:hypothetical protein
MKECFYCLEPIPKYEYVCSHCRSWQPSKSEIDKKYNEVVKSLAFAFMGWKSFWKSFGISVIFVMVLHAILAGLEYQGTTSAELFALAWAEKIRSSSTVILFLIFFAISLRVSYSGYAYHVVKNEGYLIEKSLRDRDMNFQAGSFSKYFLAVGIIVIVFLLLR